MTWASVEIIFGMAATCASDISTPTTVRRGKVRACSSDMPANFEASTGNSGINRLLDRFLDRLLWRSPRSIRREIFSPGVDAGFGGFAVLGGVALLHLPVGECGVLI